MDEIDILILRELMKDAQTPFLRIAKKLEVSPETVRKRYRKMKKDGTIKQCSVSIDLSKIGYQGKVFLMITIGPNNDKSKTVAVLKKMGNVFVASEIIGDFDIIGIAPIKDLKSLEVLVNRIKEEPSVNRVEIALIYDTAFPINQRFGKLSF